MYGMVRTLTSEVAAAAPGGGGVTSSLEPPLPPPVPDGAEPVYSKKIRDIVSEISQLTLLETAQLNELLKKTLNIPDTPMMPMGAMLAATGPATQEGVVEEKQEEEQTAFTVKLVSFADDAKIKVIKEVKTLSEGMNLVQAKKLVESLPQVLQKEVGKEEALRLKAVLEAAGGTVELE